MLSCHLRKNLFKNERSSIIIPNSVWFDKIYFLSDMKYGLGDMRVPERGYDM